MGGRRGPAPKPTVLRLLDGDKANRFNPDEPVPAAELPECPAQASPAVREIWDYTVTQLDFMGLAKAADRDALFCYCEAVVAHRKASEVLAKSAILIKGAMGGLVRNPALAIQRDAAFTIRQYAQEFGLTPSARSRVAANALEQAADDDNPFAGTG
jgi:P27 family predicted phage terminase small subunit